MILPPSLPALALPFLLALPALTSARDPHAPHALKVAVLDLAVVDNSYGGDSDSLRHWMLEAGIDPTRLLREALGRADTYAALNPRPQVAPIESPLVARALTSNGVSPHECLRTECVIRVGRTLDADRVVTGEVTKLSTLIWFVTGRVVDVRSGRVLRQDELEVKGVIADLLPKVMVVLARRMATA